MQVCAIVCACCARALLLACPDGHMEDGNDSLSLQVFFDGIEQDQSVLPHLVSHAKHCNPRRILVRFHNRHVT